MPIHRASIVLCLLLSACVEKQDFTPVGDIQISVPETPLTIRDGASLDVPVTLVRGTGQTGEVSLVAADLPIGVTAIPTAFAAGETQANLSLRVNGAALGTQVSIKLLAESNGKAAEAAVTILPIGKIGSIDRRFGTSGKVSLSGPIGTECRTWRLQDNKTLLDTSAAGAVSFVRLLPDGTLDTTFGVGGSVSFPLFFGSMVRERYSPVKVVIQPDNKILVATSGDDPNSAARPDALMFFRLMPDGSPDTSFGIGGFSKIDDALRVYAMAATPNGDLLAWTGHSADSILTRVLPNGTIGASSAVIAESTLGHAHVDMILQRDGKVLVLGLLPTGWSLGRFDTNLALDFTFGRNGLMQVVGTPLHWFERSDGGFVGVGNKSNAPTVGVDSPHMVQFDRAWRARDGFENGGLTLVASPNSIFWGALPTDQGTLATGVLDGAARAAHILDNGQVDMTLGPKGYSFIDSIPVAAVGFSVSPADDHGAIFSYARIGQSCEVFRLWR